MKLRLTGLTVLMVILSIESHSQNVTGIVPGKNKFHPYLSLGGAASFSVIDNRMEIRGAYKSGINYMLAVHTKPWFFWSAEYTRFGTHDAHPAINDIHAWNSEMNGNILFNLGATALKFKTNFGLGYMEWNGTYIGPSWNDNRNYQIGMTLTDHWIYGTLGSGLERDLGRYFSVSADFRFRFASGNNELLSISDTGFFFGASWNLRKRLPQSAKNNNASNRRTNNQKRSRVYKWLKSRRSS